VYAKFRCAALRLKKDLRIFRELIPTRTTTRVAFWDPSSGSKNKNKKATVLDLLQSLKRRDVAE